MKLADFVDNALTLKDPNALFASYLGALSEFGVDRVLYSALRNTPYEETSVPGISHSYPADWISYYMANNYVAIDPVRQHGLCVRGAFTWKDMRRVRDLSSHQITLMNEGEDAGLHDGIALAFHGPMGEVYGVGMASSAANPDAGGHLKSIEVLSTNFHIFYSALHDEKRNAVGIELTQREMEVLKWCAAGKSNWAIGEILSISEHGVDFHMRNILRKLNADSRMTAVVKAIHNGIITL